MSNVILIRHGETILGSQKRYMGHSDSPLIDSGREHVARLKPLFNQYSFDHIFSSDLVRCRETASILAGSAPIQYSSSLREINFGQWEGATAAECQQRYPEQFSAWMRDPTEHTPPNGESLLQLCQRVCAFVADLAMRFSDQTIALITHAGAIRVLLASGVAQFWSVVVPMAAFFECEWDVNSQGVSDNGLGTDAGRPIKKYVLLSPDDRQVAQADCVR